MKKAGCIPKQVFQMDPHDLFWAKYHMKQRPSRGNNSGDNIRDCKKKKQKWTDHILWMNVEAIPHIVLRWNPHRMRMRDCPLETLRGSLEKEMNIQG